MRKPLTGVCWLPRGRVPERHRLYSIEDAGGSDSVSKTSGPRQGQVCVDLVWKGI